MANSEDTVRQIDKALDVLSMVELMLMREAQMNALKHMNEVVRPVPLYGAVSSLIGDLTAWRTREMEDHVEAEIVEED